MCVLSHLEGLLRGILGASSNICAPNYRAEKKSLQILLSSTQAGPGRKVKQEQEEISRNHVPRLFLGSVCVCSTILPSSPTASDKFPPAQAQPGQLRNTQYLSQRWVNVNKQTGHPVEQCS